MALVIDPDRIAAKDLSDYEVQYLRDRNRLPSDYFEAEPVEVTQPSIGEPGGIDDESDEDEDYEEGWNNTQRRAELSRRKLSVDGNKDELIARLRRSDTDQLQEDDYSTLED